VLEVIGDLLPAGLAVALSPFPVIAIVLVLSSDRASTLGPAFAAGWLVGLSAITAGFIAFAGGTSDPGEPAPLLGWLRVVLGLGLLALAVAKWWGRPPAGEEVPLPPWMASLDDLSPTRAVGYGAALGGLNPKNLALAGAGGTTIGQAALGAQSSALAGLVFVALGSSTVVGAVVAHLVAGERAAPALSAVSQFMTDHHTGIMVVVLALLGATVLGEGLGAI
jgi:hypothetical protein